MTIYYKGWGLLSPIIVIAMNSLAILAMIPFDYFATWPLVIATIIAGAISFALGRFLFDKKEHSIFWIGFEKLGIIYILLSVVLYIASFF